MLALTLALAFYLTNAHRTYREDGYWDFILQWTLARLAVTEDGSKVYDFPTQKALLTKVLPPESLHFLERAHIKDVGVSPYPPTMVVLYAPLGLLSLRGAQICMVYLSVGLAIASAWAISRAVNGRVTFSMALLAIIYYPGFLISASLGQNALLLLALWSLGWLALCRHRDILAGVIWGLLIYKIHWVVAVGWLPLVLGRPRALLGMACSALALVAVATLAFGAEVWGLWLRAAQTIAAAYHEPVYVQQLLGKACDLRGAVARYSPDAIASDAVTAVTACPLLFTAALVSPYIFHYDLCVFLLPLLVLWSHRAIMSRGQRAVLIGVSAAFYLAMPIMDQWTVDWLLGLKGLVLGSAGLEPWWEPWQGPPLATFANVGLWLTSLWVAHSWSRGTAASVT
jgi:hypothetical protein